jgi:hypothetical protein
MKEEKTIPGRIRIAPDLKQINSEMAVLQMLLAIHIEDYYCDFGIDDGSVLSKPGINVYHGSFDITFYLDAIDGQFRIMMPEIKRLLYSKFHKVESSGIFNYIADLKTIFSTIQSHLASSRQTTKKVAASYKYLFGSIELPKAKPLLEIKIKYIIELIEYLYSIAPEEAVKPVPNKKQRPTITRWSDAFCRTTDYLNITDILIREGCLSKDSFLYQDTRKGNKGFIVAIIKYLWNLKYYKPGLGRLRGEEIQLICKELGVVVSLAMITKVKIEDYDLSFIPQEIENE